MPQNSYNCDICQDTGYVHPRKGDGMVDYSRVITCKCIRDEMQKKKMKWMVERCELPPYTEHMTFNNLKYVPAMSKAIELAKSIAEGDDGPCFLTLAGEVDTGKTHLSVAITRRWLERGIAAKYTYAPLLLDELRSHFQDDGDYSYRRRYDFYLNVPLLLLDDLGTEYKTLWVQEKLDTIIDYRLMNNLQTLVTTNCTREELGFRIISRLERNGRILGFDKVPRFKPEVK